MRSHRRIVALGAALAVVLAPGTAHADPAGPTDFRTEIVAVTPETPGIELSVEGGDSFVRVDVEPGIELIVLGYAGEPYLRIADAEIAHNLRSAATYDNEDRYGGAEIPSEVDPDAPPDWERIGSGWSWSWHDHRAHWMEREPPVGLEPGDAIPMPDIALLVDGSPVTVEVTTVLQESPSWWPAVFGLLVGLQLVLVAGMLGRASLTMATVVLAVAALIVGVGQYVSLSAATGPLITWWLMPAIALAAPIVAIAVYGRSEFVERGLVAVAGLQLALWAFLRRDALTAAVLPTDLPFWFDRAVTAGVLVGGLAVTVTVLAPLLRPPPAPAT